MSVHARDFTSTSAGPAGRVAAPVCNLQCPSQLTRRVGAPGGRVRASVGPTHLCPADAPSSLLSLGLVLTGGHTVFLGAKPRLSVRHRPEVTGQEGRASRPALRVCRRPAGDTRREAVWP